MVFPKSPDREVEATRKAASWGRAASDFVSRDFERDVLGALVVPSGRTTRMVSAIRRRVAGLHRRVAPPPLRILEAMLGQLDGHALHALVELGVPDAIDKRATVEDLAESVGADCDDLRRLLRYCAARGLIRLDRKGRVRETGITRALRSDTAAPWKGWVAFAGSDWFSEAFRALPEGVGAGAPSAFEAAHGTDLFTYITEVRPEAGEAFNEAMAAGATLQAVGLAKGLEWDGITSVCDVGGGTGAALEVLQRYHPELDVTLFDLPAVVARARLVPKETAPGRRILERGDFFGAVPPGRDRYLLLAVIHDWDDHQARRILGNVRAVLGTEGRAVVVENIASEHPTDDFAAASDLLMLALASGRERTDREYRDLFESADLAVVDDHLLPTGSRAYELVPLP